MPALTYTSSNFPFVPFTKIYSADVNTCFTDIRTLLNTTKLDDDNLQNAGITRATKLKTGTASYVLINNGSGAMSEEQYLALARGGLNRDITPAGTQDTGKAILVNGAGTGFELAVAQNPTANIFSYQNFT